MAFDSWHYCDACEHEGGMLSHHHLGNASLVGMLRRLLAPHNDRLPIIATKVVHNGTHAGDCLSISDVEQLATEVEMLAQIHDADRESEKFLRNFENQLRELVGCSLRVRKPIVF